MRFRIVLPDGWKVVEESAGLVRIKFGKMAGGMSVKLRPLKKDLESVREVMLKKATESGWKVITAEQTQLSGRVALLMLIEVKTGLANVTTRQMFYIFNAHHGLYMLHFGARDTEFKRSVFDAVARSFKSL
jgi:hypothetical protein